MFTSYSLPGFYLMLFLLLCVLLRLFMESFFHNKRLNSIRYRIHVNGTRGKSSVSRLIAAGLRNGAITTFCKTTGTTASYIYPDGSEELVFRVGGANIIEQVGVVKKAAACAAEAMVVECMALQPVLQSTCELKLIKSTHGVCVNAREDHLDVMGPGERDVALALSGTVSVNGLFFTPEVKYLQIFRDAAADRNTQLIHISEAESGQVTEEELSRFRYEEYDTNVALALKVCESCGIDRRTALDGMWQATPDPGALTVNHVTINGKKIIFANGFAANDPESTGALWHKMIEKFPAADEVVGLVNCRDDRGDRSRQLAEVIDGWTAPDRLIAIGTGTALFLKQLKKETMTGIGIIDAREYDRDRILELLTGGKGEHVLCIGILNIKGIGFELLDFMREQEQLS